MDWIDYVIIFILALAFGTGLDSHLSRSEKNQEKIIEQNEQIIELLKANSNDKEIQFVR